MMLRWRDALFAVVLLSVSSAGGTPSKLSEAALAAISERGILLAGYDTAAWRATDAVMTLHPPEGTVSRYIAQKTAKGWVVAFGRLNAAKDKFLVGGWPTFDFFLMPPPPQLRLPHLSRFSKGAHSISR